MSSSNLPPNVPSDPVQLVRAIELLNQRVQGEVTNAEQTELKGLLGAFPSHAQAAVWRQGLKRILDSTDGTARKIMSELGQADDRKDGSSEE
jgi:hypothetical protein